MSPETQEKPEPTRNLRVPKEEWGPFGDATKAVHPEGRSPRAQVIRQFMRWYMRRPGATLPTRPEKGPWSTPSE